MNKEIKEILAYFEEYIKVTDMHDSEPMLNWKDLKIVLDYITNLQTIEQQYSAILSENAELEQENERYKKCKKQKIKVENACSNYKYRINKAIEYMNNYNELVIPTANIKSLVLKEEYKKIIHILQGENKE